MNENTIAIEFKDVTKSFHGEAPVLTDVSFQINEGETCFLYGPSNTAKTTILKLITREYLPDQGSINIFGDNIVDFNTWQTALYRRYLGIIWQDLKLLNNKTIFENLALPLIIRDMKDLSIKEKVNEWLASNGLYEIKDKFPNLLPHGLLQKVAVLRALIVNPKIIIADEPMSHIDTDSEKEIWDIINRYKDDNTTILWATSQKYVIENFKGRVIKLEKGKICRDALHASI